MPDTVTKQERKAMPGDLFRGVIGRNVIVASVIAEWRYGGFASWELALTEIVVLLARDNVRLMEMVVELKERQTAPLVVDAPQPEGRADA